MMPIAPIPSNFSKNNDSAFFYAKKMYSTASKIKSPDDQLDALKKLIKLKRKKLKTMYSKLKNPLLYYNL